VAELALSERSCSSPQIPVILSISKGVTAFLLAKSYKTSHDLSMIMTTRSSRSVHCSLARTLLFISFMAVCLALFQTSQAVSPPPDGGYPGGNTAEGQDAVLSLTSGTYNTATGYLALASNTAGDASTATGYRALHDNVTGIQNTAIGFYAGHDVTGDGNVCIGAMSLGRLQ
jgi:hypothetical protein